jgi:hypothetical protein
LFLFPSREFLIVIPRLYLCLVVIRLIVAAAAIFFLFFLFIWYDRLVDQWHAFFHGSPRPFPPYRIADQRRSEPTVACCNVHRKGIPVMARITETTQTGDSIFLARGFCAGIWKKKRKAYILRIRRRFEHGSDTTTPHCLETSHGSILISESVV